MTHIVECYAHLRLIWGVDLDTAYLIMRSGVFLQDNPGGEQ